MTIEQINKEGYKKAEKIKDVLNTMNVKDMFVVVRSLNGNRLLARVFKAKSYIEIREQFGKERLIIKRPPECDWNEDVVNIIVKDIGEVFYKKCEEIDHTEVIFDTPEYGVQYIISFSGVK